MKLIAENLYAGEEWVSAFEFITGLPGNSKEQPPPKQSEATTPTVESESDSASEDLQPMPVKTVQTDEEQHVVTVEDSLDSTDILLTPIDDTNPQVPHELQTSAESSLSLLCASATLSRPQMKTPFAAKRKERLIVPRSTLKRGNDTVSYLYNLFSFSYVPVYWLKMVRILASVALSSGPVEMA